MKINDFYDILKMIRRHLAEGGMRISYGASMWVEVESRFSDNENSSGNFMLRPAIDCSRRAGKTEENFGSEAALCLSVLKMLEKICSKPELAMIFMPKGKYRKLGFSSEAQREQAVWRIAQKLEPVLKSLGFDWND